MALYRFAAGVIARGRGHSSTAAAAYRAGERITDERTGQTFDYSRKAGVLWKGIYAPANAPDWMQDRAKLWNAVEQHETRANARTARDFIVCIPHELDVEQGRRLVGDFVREQFARKGFVADAAIHAPGRGGDERNIHAHFLVTTRQFERGRFVEKKDRTQNEKATLLHWREAWAKLANRHWSGPGSPAISTTGATRPRASTVSRVSTRPRRPSTWSGGAFRPRRPSVKSRPWPAARRSPRSRPSWPGWRAPRTWPPGPRMIRADPKAVQRTTTRQIGSQWPPRRS